MTYRTEILRPLRPGDAEETQKRMAAMPEGTALRIGAFAGVTARGEGRNDAADCVFVHIVGIVRTVIPFAQLAMPFVGEFDDGVEERLEAGHAANILRRAAALAIDQARISQIRLTGPD